MCIVVRVRENLVDFQFRFRKDEINRDVRHTKAVVTHIIRFVIKERGQTLAEYGETSIMDSHLQRHVMRTIIDLRYHTHLPNTQDGLSRISVDKLGTSMCLSDDDVDKSCDD